MNPIVWQTIVAFLLLPLAVMSQSSQYPEDVFRSPLDIPLALSGTFCEVRTNHFHSGVDFRTQGRTGHQVYAIADGYVSRIKEKPSGFGKAVYIDHPNGYTSVYAHLKEFSPRLEEYVEKRQYEKESFSIDLRPEEGVLPVRKGEVIARSGNSGSSAGPHVHFEIRDSDSQQPINPLYFGFDVNDRHRPHFMNVMIYDLGAGRFGSKPHEIALRRRKVGQYYVSGNSVHVNSRRIGIGARVFDRSHGSTYKNGVYFLQVTVDGDTLYQFRSNRFAFYQTRYANAHIDYATKAEDGIKIRQLFQKPHDRFPGLKKEKQRGIVRLDDDKTHDVTVLAMDTRGNRSELSFQVQYHPGKTPFAKSTVWYDKMLLPNHSGQFIADGINARFPKGAFYDTVHMRYQRAAPEPGLYSPIHRLHNTKTPVHKYFTLQIKPRDVPAVHKDKALIVYRSREDGTWQGDGGDWMGQFLQEKTRAFGEYSVMIDTVPPKIRPVNFKEYATVSRNRTLQVKISDNLAGIDSYRPEVDGNWVLMEHDAKNNLLIYYFDDRFPEGRHEFKLTVTDEVGNKTIFKTKLTR